MAGWKARDPTRAAVVALRNPFTAILAVPVPPQAISENIAETANEVKDKEIGPAAVEYLSIYSTEVCIGVLLFEDRKACSIVLSHIRFVGSASDSMVSSSSNARSGGLQCPYDDSDVGSACITGCITRAQSLGRVDFDRGCQWDSGERITTMLQPLYSLR